MQETTTMGEAFRDGERLGEATGATKAEVLDALERAHPDADEIRIRTLKDQIVAATSAAPESEPMLKFFTASHLPPNLRQVSQPFCNLAFEICNLLPRNPERTVALRKLLESKDCAVRSVL